MWWLRLGMFILAVLAGGKGVARAEDWRLVGHVRGVQVYQRHVAFSPVDEVRAVATFEIPIDAVRNALADVEAYPKRIPPTVSAVLLKKEGERRYYRMEINPPIVARRFYCMHWHTERSNDGVVRVEWGLANELCPATLDRMVRIEDNAGAWTLVPLGPSRTQVIYQAHTDPGGSIPAWLVNQGVVTQVPDLFAALRKAAVLPRYNVKNP